MAVPRVSAAFSRQMRAGWPRPAAQPARRLSSSMAMPQALARAAPWQQPKGADVAGQYSVPFPTVDGTPDLFRRAEDLQAAQTCTAPAEEELLLRISRLIEDDPNLAARFAERLRLGGRECLAGLEAACIEGEKADICPPTSTQLRQVWAASALPFLGFGILDNAIMIIFGDVLDMSLCTTLGFSTMAAAALGNTFSDGIGVFSGGMVEDMAAKAGFEAPSLSRAQEDLGCTKRAERFGQLFGITAGCLIGMFPLLFMHTKDQEAARRVTMMNMYNHAVVGVQEILSAEAAMIALVDEDDQLVSASAAHHGKEFAFRVPVGEGVWGYVAQTGQFLNIADLTAPDAKEYYRPELDGNFADTGIAVKSVLCMPILGYDEASGRCDKVLGVVGVVNKKDTSGFSERDEDALAALCAHISTSLSFAHGGEHGFQEALERLSQALRTRGVRINPAANHRVHNLYVAVMQQVCGVVKADRVELLAVDAANNEVRYLASTADAGKVSAHERSPVCDAGIVAEAVSRRRPVLRGGQLCCPVLDSNGKAIGAVRVIALHDEERSFGEEEVHFVTSIAHRMALTMEGPGSSLGRLLLEIQRRPEE